MSNDDLMLITVYARKEPTTDSLVDPSEQRMDVQIYKDKEATRKFARFPWYYSSKPTKRNKYVTLNCYKWRLQWID